MELSAEQVREAGIETEAAAPREIEELLRATAVVGDNLDAQAHVTPRSAGLVRGIFAGLGDVVEEGAPLCEIESIELGAVVSSALEDEARYEAARKALARESELQDRAVAIAEEIQQREKGLSEREISTLRPLFEAERALQDARLQRDRRLLELEAEVEQARIRMEGSRRRLRVLGIDPALLVDDDASEAVRAGRYTIVAPRAGAIVERDITLNEHVDAEDKVYRIQDLSQVWVLASVYEQDLTKVRVGAPARVRLDAFPETEFEGTVAFIDVEVDRAARAVRVRVELENEPLPGWEEPFPVRPGMFGRVAFTVSTRQAAVVIPEAAVVHADGGPRVFVAEGEGRFHGRPVRISEPAGSVVEVLDGVAAGEQVVVRGSFLLTSVARAEELGGGHSH